MHTDPAECQRRLTAFNLLLMGAHTQGTQLSAAFIFDLDGTLIDSVYAHVIAWQQALRESGLAIDSWRIHRRIGMSGNLFTRAIAHESGRELTSDEAESLQQRHSELFRLRAAQCPPLAGATELLATLRGAHIPHGIATSGRREEIEVSLDKLRIGAETVVVDARDVARAKPAPDLFLACQQRLGVAVRDCFIVGDAVWDILASRRAGMLSIGLLSGGRGAEELAQAGAFRVYRDPSELHASLDELDVPSEATQLK